MQKFMKCMNFRDRELGRSDECYWPVLMDNSQALSHRSEVLIVHSPHFLRRRGKFYDQVCKRVTKIGDGKYVVRT